MMNAGDTLRVIRTLESDGIDVWLGDGGWGVDALLGRQTRAHQDVDLIIRVDQAAVLVGALARQGFAVVEGQLSSCFVLRDTTGRAVDVHPVVFDAAGNGHYTMTNGDVWIYRGSWFDGQGVIGGEPVRCLTPEGQVRCHTGYALDDDDRQDMAALLEHFGVGLLPEQRGDAGRPVTC
jgi:lincosamide nucleotidyltransferase A/C/D/E